MPVDNLSGSGLKPTPCTGVVKGDGAESRMGRQNNNLHPATCLRRSNSSEPIHKSALFQRRQKNAQAIVPDINSLRVTSLEPEGLDDPVDTSPSRPKNDQTSPGDRLGSPPTSPSRPSSARRSGSTPLLTPPEELDSFTWGSILSPCHSSPEQQDSLQNLSSGATVSDQPQDASSSNVLPASGPVTQSLDQAQGVTFQGGAGSNDGAGSAFIGESGGWLVQAATIAGKILSQ